MSKSTLLPPVPPHLQKTESVFGYLVTDRHRDFFDANRLEKSFHTVDGALRAAASAADVSGSYRQLYWMADPSELMHKDLLDISYHLILARYVYNAEKDEWFIWDVRPGGGDLERWKALLNLEGEPQWMRGGLVPG